MLSPHELQTNVLYAENVTSISWRALVLSSSTYKTTKDPQITAFEYLSVAWSDLVENGYIAQYDYISRMLWAFELPKACVNQAGSRKAGKVLDLLSRQVLKQLDRGTLQASELEHTHRRPLQSATNARPGFNNSQSPRSHGTGLNGDRQHEGEGPFVHFGRHDIYDAFINALLETLSYKIASQRLAVPLCFNLLLFDLKEPITAKNQDHNSTIDAGLAPVVYPYCPVHVGAEWLPDGRITYVTWHSSALCKPVSTSPALKDATASAEVILAPFGLNIPFNRLQFVSYANHTDTTFGQNRGSQIQKRRIVAELLSQRGIELRRPHEWVSCQLNDATPDAEAREASQSLLWPRELVFAVDLPSTDIRETSWTDPKSFLDPLSVAFDFQDLRVPEFMEEDDLETPKLDDISAPTDLYADMLSDVLGPSLALGMYPTPPELTRSHGGLQRERAEFSAPTPATTTSGLGYGHEEAVMSPEQIREEQYSHMDADDLFGDFDMDMHSVVLKEDEFGLFDIVPKGGEPYKQTGDRTPATELTTDFAERSRQNKDKTVKFEQHLPEESIADPSGNLEVSHLDVDALAVANENKYIQDSAENPCPKPTQNLQDQVMDEKYKAGGLFNVPPSGLPAMHDPRIQPVPRMVIPFITTTEQINAVADTSSGTSNTDESDSDSDTTSASNRDDEASDDSMEGVVSIQSEARKSMTESDDETLSLVELVSHRRNMSIMNLGLSNNNFQRLSASLDLDGKQYMDLAHQVAYQICHWPLSRGSLHPTNRSQKPVQSLSEKQRTDRKDDDRLVDINSASITNDSCPNAPSFCFLFTLSVLEQISLALKETYAHVSRGNMHACVEFEPGQIVTNNGSDTAQSPGQWERNFKISPEENAPQLRTSNVALRRNEGKVVISATAISLWAELGLGPIGSPKRVSAYCFVPNSKNWIQGAFMFLKIMGEAFSQLKLGEHVPGPKVCSECHANGVVTVETADSFQPYLQNLCRSLNRFGHKLVQQEQGSRMVMIYIVCSSEDTLVIPFLCAAFQRLRRLVWSKQRSKRWHLLLRVLPGSLFVQDFAFSSPSMTAANTLGREVFDLCCQTEDISNQNESLATLARPLPGKVGFLLQQNPSRRPLDTPLITHVSYSWRPGNPWVSFAFCDDVGNRRWHTSYHLPLEISHLASHSQNQSQTRIQPGNPTTDSANSSGNNHTNFSLQFANIARDMLKDLVEISEDLMQSKPHTHYVFLVKDGSITREEMRSWRVLMEQTAKPNGLAAILKGHNSGVGGNNTTNYGIISSILMNWTIAILDCECPLELSLPNAVSSDHENRIVSALGTGDKARHWAQDMPTSTPGTPSLASPGLASGGLTGSFPRDSEERDMRLVATNSLSWFLPARSVIVQNYSGKLEVLPTWTLPATASAGQMGGPRNTVISGGGYLLITGDDVGSTQESGDTSGRRVPKPLSLRIMAAKGPSLMDLRQLAEAYRGLTTIANIFGLGSTLPWHVAMARKSRIGLGECM